VRFHPANRKNITAPYFNPNHHGIISSEEHFSLSINSDLIQTYLSGRSYVSNHTETYLKAEGLFQGYKKRRCPKSKNKPSLQKLL